MSEQDVCLGDVTAIVVHHRSYDTVALTSEALLAQGIRSERVLVVDNSEEPALRQRLAASLPEGVHLLHVRNRGYGAAVNAGVDWLQHHGEDAQFVLVTSHESRPEAGAVARLRNALQEDPSAAVAGPTLVTGQSEAKRIWSQGGYLAPVTHWPKHHGYGGPVLACAERSPVPRQWLDGAFLLYRRSDLDAFRFCEDYFLYMEETDLHLRLGEAGRKALWVPDAVTWQSSQGVPPYYFARNLRLLYARTDAAWRRCFVARALVLRRLAVAALRGRIASEGLPLIKGSLERLPRGERAPNHRTVVVNPLAVALHHYQAELVSTLSALQVQVTVLATPEPSAGHHGRIGWLAAYLRLLAKASVLTRRGSHGRLLVLWPALGYLDLPLVRAAAGRQASLVLHDPVPLVSAVGYGRLSRRLGTRLGARARVIVHSETAKRALDTGVEKGLVTVLPHPILPPEANLGSTPSTTRPVIRVLGQYKPDRDLIALSALAEHFGKDALLEVYGRGWPAIAGWTVEPRFVSEAEMEALIASSDVVVIPYRRFFQSGVAIRCLERAVPVVGPASSSLQDVYGAESQLLVRDGGDWSSPVEYALEHGHGEAVAAARNWRQFTEKAWRAWQDI